MSLYLKGIFFFDSQPPLGKQLIAMSAYIAGYNGEHNFNNIGGSECLRILINHVFNDVLL